MAKRWTKRWLRDKEIPRLERVLKDAQLASVEEIKALADEYKGGSHADYCEWCRKLSTFARRQEFRAREEGRKEDAESYEVALAALEDRAEVVELPSIDRTFRITPASWARIMKVEDLDWWLMRLSAARLVIKRDADNGQSVDDLDETLQKIDAEILHGRERLYAEITAEGPRPSGERVDWADDITPEEEGALLEAWHRVNTDRLTRLPKPKSKKDDRKLPTTWSMVFQSVAWRERRPPVEIIRDRSLVSLCAESVLEAIKADEGKASVSDLD